ncbi:MAG: (Fe-S)-binding protein [Anaerolineaceae bacterium]|nr:(Fe-S)-binding protein [Anaerolineaceae bacterium]
MAENNNNVEIAMDVLEKSLTRQMDTYLNVCAHCGLCNDSCHYFVAMNDAKMVPTYKTDRLRNVWRKEHEWIGKIFPKWVGAYELTEERLDEMAEIAFRDCTTCGRCVHNCPFGVDTRAIVKTMRSMALATGKAPEILVQLADSAIAREESFDLFKDFFLDGIKEMEPELKEITGDPEATIPIEKKARILYVPLSGKHTILPAASIFHKAGESWTLSMFDAANYGVFLNDIERSKKIADRIVKEAKRLEVEEVIITECGHAYSTFRWSVPNWYEEPLPFSVRSIVEIIPEYIRDGRIKVRNLEDLGTVTLHDPCNLGRGGGVFKEPREILNHITTDFREMAPTGVENFCCGGGGGLVANLDYEDVRMTAGKPKADQIRATKADLVVASCDNCRHQIGELSDHYELGVNVIGLSELVSRAMIID